VRKVLIDKPQLDVTVKAAEEEADGWVVVRVAGELDLHTAPLLRDRITDVVVTRSRPRVILDLADLRFCDSTGLGILVALHKRLHSATGALVLAGITGQPLQLLSRTGLDQRLLLAADVAAAKGST
jgi:anti-anti-sigma factor